MSGGFRDLMKWICNPVPNRSATLISFFGAPIGTRTRKGLDSRSSSCAKFALTTGALFWCGLWNSNPDFDAFETSASTDWAKSAYCNQFFLLYADYKGEFMERTIGIEPILPASKTGALSIGRHAHIKRDTVSFQDHSLK